MPDNTGDDDPTVADALPAEDPRATVEAYETDDGTVLYDARNPLAWVKASNAQSVEETR